MTAILSKTAFAIHKAFKADGTAISRAQVQEILAAGLGYNSLASYQTSSEENPGLDAAEYILFDAEAMGRRAAMFGIASFPAIGVVMEFNRVASPVRATLSFEDFADEIRMDVETKIVIESEDVASAMAETNAYGGDMDAEFDEPEIGIADAEDFWEVPVSGTIQMDQDTEKPFSGDQIEVSGIVRFTKVGRRCLAAMEIDVGAAVDNSYFDED